MMRVLLDTHAFLWWTTNDPQLSDSARQLIADKDNSIYVSAASAWEIATKQRIGKLISNRPRAATGLTSTAAALSGQAADQPAPDAAGSR